MSNPGQRAPPILAARTSASDYSDASTRSPRNTTPGAAGRRSAGRDGGNGSGGNGSGSGNGEGRSRPKRTLIESACSACRRRKSRCDGVRPACTRCQALRTECLYEAEEGESRWSALRRRNQILETERAEVRELLAYVQSLPEPEAQDIFNRIRQGPHDDIFRLLREVRASGIASSAASSMSPNAHTLPLHPASSVDGQNRLPPISAMFDMSTTPGSSIPPPPNMQAPAAYYLKSEHSHGSTSSGASYPSEPPVTTGP